MLRGLRGATTVEANTESEVLEAVQEMLLELAKRNNLKIEDIAAAIFSSTPDLTAVFPAKAARLMGWEYVPLFGTQEIDCECGIPLCIRVLLLINTDKPQNALKHVYLRKAACLRPDL